MRKVESCFQRLEQRYALFTPGSARADHFWEMVSPAPADVVRTTLFSVFLDRAQLVRENQRGKWYDGWLHGATASLSLGMVRQKLVGVLSSDVEVGLSRKGEAL